MSFVFCSHHYVTPDLKKIAIESGGIVGDSLEIAKFCMNSSSNEILIAGSKFMGETAKILSPEKKIYMLSKYASCSLTDDVDFNDFRDFVLRNPSKKVVVYANSSAEIKSLADYVVTSSNACQIIEHIDNLGYEVAFGTDSNLAKFVIKKTGIEFDYFHGACVVHEEFNLEKTLGLKLLHPKAEIVSHPEAGLPILDASDYVGSTSGMINYIKNSTSREFIVITDKSLILSLSDAFPEKSFIPGPTGKESASCSSCARCPHMKLNEISLLDSFRENEVILSPELISSAKVGLMNMLDF